MTRIEVPNFINTEIRWKPRKKTRAGNEDNGVHTELEEPLHGLSRKLLFTANVHPFSTAPRVYQDTLLPRGVFILRLLVRVNLPSVTQEFRKDAALAESTCFSSLAWLSLADDGAL